MASTRYAPALVLGIVVVSLTLSYSFAFAHEASTTRKGRKCLAGIASRSYASSPNGFLDEVSGAALAGIAGKGLEGRTMEAFIHRLLKEETHNIKQGLDEKPKISGNQDSKKVSEGAAQDSPLKKAQVSSSTEGMRFPDTKPQEQETSKSYLDEDEIVRAINRDYGPKDRPRRKPPVNNHKPIN